VDSLLGLFFVLAIGRALLAPALDELGHRLERRALAKRDIHTETEGSA